MWPTWLWTVPAHPWFLPTRQQLVHRTAGPNPKLTTAKRSEKSFWYELSYTNSSSTFLNTRVVIVCCYIITTRLSCRILLNLKIYGRKFATTVQGWSSRTIAIGCVLTPTALLVKSWSTGSYEMALFQLGKNLSILFISSFAFF